MNPTVVENTETTEIVERNEMPVNNQAAETPTALVPNDIAQDLRSKWDSIQGAFVDDPKSAVSEADKLVDYTMKRIDEVFTKERENLERQWSSGADASTEDLRVALRRYRSFFQRLLSV